MPWYWKQQPYYRRRRLWRRRFRPPFRRRLWRRRKRPYRYRVRKRKLPFLHLKEWQPRFIDRLKITGLIPLYITTSDRIANNLRLYEDEIAPHGVPSLGGFSVTVFTLRSLFQLFQKGRAWWTRSNNELPLIRYTGCTFKFFRPEASDAIVTWHNCFPMIPNIDTYNSTQPTIMQLSRYHKLLRCKKHNNIKKPYQKIKVKPPSQMTNKWFFQKELADVPLILLMSSAVSADRWYINSNAQSSTIGFTSINTEFFKYHNWATPTTSGYHPQDGVWLWTFQQSTPKPSTINDVLLKNLIFLGATNNYSMGSTIIDIPATDLQQGTQTDWQKKVAAYSKNSGYWGNIFMSPYFTKNQYLILQTGFSINSLPQHFTITNINENSKISDYNNAQGTENYKFKLCTDHFTISCRYNPYPDTGINNQIFLTSLTEVKSNWTPPTNINLRRDNLPFWIGLWGYIDYQKITKDAQTIDTLKVITLKSTFIHPPLSYYVPVDKDFLGGWSPYRPREPVTASDKLNWHPKTTTQYQSITHICQSGPGTIKLPTNISAECHAKFTFYFKLGGCAAPLKTIEDPENQPEFPVPYNILRSTSLQSPDIPFQNFLYSFDWRRDFLTKKATDRIQKYADTEKTIIEPTGLNLLNPLPAPEETTSETDTSHTKKEKETYLRLLQHQQLKQLRYKHRILKLMQSLK